MPARDFLFLVVICLIWSVNLVLTHWVIEGLQVPALFLAGVRMALQCLVLFAFLRPVPRQLGKIFVISMGIGAVHYGCLYVGLAHSKAGAAAIVLQLEIPLTTLMSVIFLGERIRIRRTIGIILSVIGVGLIVLDPDDLTLSFGLVLVAASAVTYSGASILMKKIEPMNSLQLQAWVASFSFAPLLLASSLTETGQIESAVSGGWYLVAALAFAVLLASVVGHGGYYVLIKRHDMSLVAPLALMNPLFAVVIGVVVLGEALTINLIAGGLMCLVGVGIIAARSNRALVTVPRRPAA